MANPRFEKCDDIGPLAMPDTKKIKCVTCTLREADRKIGDMDILGASLGICDAFKVKPQEILFGNEECPYYVDEDLEE